MFFAMYHSVAALERATDSKINVMIVEVIDGEEYPHIFYLMDKAVPAGEELLIDYGKE
jgi:hypothetical protein